MDPTMSMYFSLLRNVLLGLTYHEQELSIIPSFRQERHIKKIDTSLRLKGVDWPVIGLTMTGMSRLSFIEDAFLAVNEKNVPGNFLECGVWKGGSSIFAAALNRAMAQSSNLSREIWLFDSFQGFPATRFKEDFEAGLDDQWSTQQDIVRISQERVQNNFKNLNLLPYTDSGIEMVKGYFEESIPKSGKKVGSISILRLDGDMYGSTMTILHGFYAQISIGGYVIIDDWNIAACREAVHEFRNSAGIREPIQLIDNSSVYWVKERNVEMETVKEWKARKKSIRTEDHRSNVFLFNALIIVGPAILYTWAFFRSYAIDREMLGNTFPFGDSE